MDFEKMYNELNKKYDKLKKSLNDEINLKIELSKRNDELTKHIDELRKELEHSKKEKKEIIKPNFKKMF